MILVGLKVETYEKIGAIKDLADQISSSISVSSAFSLCLEEVCFSPFCIFFLCFVVLSITNCLSSVQLLEYHRKHPCAPLVDNEAVLKEDPVIAFTREVSIFFWRFFSFLCPVVKSSCLLLQECFGRYLDLHDLHNQYINSSFGERVDYSTYLDVFSQPEKISPELKMSR